MNTKKSNVAVHLLNIVWLAALIGACGSDVDSPNESNEEEVITTVRLTFVPDGGGTDVVAEFDDADGDGGEDPTIDKIVLENAESYTLNVSFLNTLENPTLDVTEEIEAEASEHQLFFLGSAVAGPSTGEQESALVDHSYGDVDAEGLPLGLMNAIEAKKVGAGEFTLILRHLPPQNDSAVKIAGLAQELQDNGVANLPGESDIRVTFEIEVQ